MDELAVSSVHTGPHTGTQNIVPLTKPAGEVRGVPPVEIILQGDDAPLPLPSRPPPHTDYTVPPNPAGTTAG